MEYGLGFNSYQEYKRAMEVLQKNGIEVNEINYLRFFLYNDIKNLFEDATLYEGMCDSPDGGRPIEITDELISQITEEFMDNIVGYDIDLLMKDHIRDYLYKQGFDIEY